MYSLVIILFFLSVLFWLARKNIIWGISFLIFLLPVYLVRTEIFGVPTTALELGIYLIFVMWLYGWWQKKYQWRWHHAFWLAIAWVVVGLLAVFISDDKVSSLGLWKGWMVDPVLLMVVVAQVVKKEWQINLLFDGFKFLLGLLGLVGLIQIIFGVVGTPDGRLAVFWDSPNYLAMILVPSLILVAAGLLKSRREWWSIIFWCVGLTALMLSASFVGIGSVVLGLMFMVWNWWARDIKKFMLGLLMVVVIVFGFIIWQSGSERLSGMVDLTQRSSVSVRLEVWRIGWEMVRQNPVWGVGLGNFEEKYLVYAPNVFHPPTEWRMLHAHNLYLHSWIEMTVFGLVVLLAIIFWWWIRLNQLGCDRQYWIAGIIAVLLAWVVGGLLDTPYYKNDLSVIFWLLFGVTVATGWMGGKLRNVK